VSASAGDAGGRLLTRAFVALTASELAYFTSLGVMLPVLPLFATESLSVGVAQVGLAVGAFSVTALLLRPWAGRWADRFGRRRVMLCGTVLFTATVFAHLFVTQYWALVGLRAVLGVAEAAFFVAGVAALADLAPPDRQGEALSYNSLGLYLGISFGPAIGEWLLSNGGFPAAWLGAAALGALSIGLVLVLPPLPGAAEDAPAGSLLPAVVIAPGLTFVAGLAGAAGFLAFASLYAREVGLAAVGGVLLVYGAVVVACRILFAKFADRMAAVSLSVAALLLVAAGLALMAAWQEPAGLYTGAALLAVGIAFLTPAFFRVMMGRLPPSQRGTAAASFSVFVDVGLGGGPILFGLLTRTGGIPGALAATAGLALMGAVLTGALGRRKSPPALVAT
jgi:predicted MFS family arabinose efflux permease